MLPHSFAPLQPTAFNLVLLLEMAELLQYQALPDPARFIRLLKVERLLRLQRTLPVCRLQQYELVHAPPYRALSYCWGKPVPDDLDHLPDDADSVIKTEELRAIDDWNERKWQAKINGKDFNIARNLRDALHMLANHYCGSWIWIDAICIDQTNILEQNSQVASMAEIYCSAIEVIVWLGEEDETAGDAFCLVNHIYQSLVPYIIQHDGNPREIQVAHLLQHNKHPGVWSGVKMDPIPNRWRSSWYEFLRRSWFRRVWTVQEYALAKEVVFRCGSLSYQNDAIAATVSYYQNVFWNHLVQDSLPSLSSGNDIIRHLAELRGLCIEGVYWNEEDQTRLEQAHGGNYRPAWLLILMVKTQGRAATNPRDRVYGIMGMLERLVSRMPGNFGPPYPNIDYAVDVETLSVQVARFALSCLPYLSYLSMVSYRQDFPADQPRLPSWAIDLAHPATYDCFAWHSRSGRVCYDVSKGAQTDTDSLRRLRKFYSDPDEMGLRGILFDSVAIVPVVDFTTHSTGCQLAYAVDKILQACRYLAKNDTVTGQTSVEDVWRTLIGNVATEYPAGAETAQFFRAWLSLAIASIYLPSENPADDEERDIVKDMWSIFESLDALHSGYGEHVADCLPTVDSLEHLARGIRPIGTEWANNLSQPANEYKRLMKTRGRQLVISERGWLALVPAGSRRGDQIVIFEGAKVPFVARIHDAPNLGTETKIKALQIIGEAYVHGIMNGEVVEDFEKDGGSVPWKNLLII